MTRVETKKKDVTPSEVYDRLQSQKEDRRLLKDLGESFGMSYGTTKNFMSNMSRLEPEVRRRVRWGRAKLEAGELSVRNACLLAGLGRREQAQVCQYLGQGRIPTLKQLRAVVSLVKEGVPVGVAVRDAPTALWNDAGRTTAGFVAFLALLKDGLVVPAVLREFGFTKWSAQRAVTDLQKDGVLDGYLLSSQARRAIESVFSSHRQDILVIAAKISGLIHSDGVTFEEALCRLNRERMACTHQA